MSDSFFLDYAQRLADQGDLAAAEDALRVRLRVSGTRPETALALAEILFRQGRPAEAIELLQGHAEDPACGDRLREHFVGESDFEAAMALLADRPKSLAASGWLDKALMRQIDGDLRGAIDACHAALDLEPDAVAALNALGRAQFNAGHPDLAFDLFSRATVLAPRSTEAWHNLAHVMRAQDNLPGADLAYQKALTYSPAHRSSRRNLAVTRLMAKQPDQALPLLQQLTTEDADDDDAQINLGACLQMLGRSAEAERQLRFMLDRSKGHFVVIAQLGSLLRKTGKFGEAYKLLTRATQMQPQNPEARVELVLTLISLERRKEAEAVLRQGLTLDPNHSDLLGLLAELSAQA